MPFLRDTVLQPYSFRHPLSIDPLATNQVELPLFELLLLKACSPKTNAMLTRQDEYAAHVAVDRDKHIWMRSWYLSQPGRCQTFLSDS
jgi:hypothetical protein